MVTRAVLCYGVFHISPCLVIMNLVCLSTPSVWLIAPDKGGLSASKRCVWSPLARSESMSLSQQVQGVCPVWSLWVWQQTEWICAKSVKLLTDKNGQIWEGQPTGKGVGLQSSKKPLLRKLRRHHYITSLNAINDFVGVFCIRGMQYKGSHHNYSTT